MTPKMLAIAGERSRADGYDIAWTHGSMYDLHARNLSPTEQRQLLESIGWTMTERRFHRLAASVTAVLAGSSGPDHEAYRTAFEASLHSHRLGVSARRSGSDIRFEFPIVAQAFARTT